MYCTCEWGGEEGEMVMGGDGVRGWSIGMAFFSIMWWLRGVGGNSASLDPSNPPTPLAPSGTVPPFLTLWSGGRQWGTWKRKHTLKTDLLTITPPNHSPFQIVYIWPAHSTTIPTAPPSAPPSLCPSPPSPFLSQATGLHGNPCKSFPQQKWRLLFLSPELLSEFTFSIRSEESLTHTLTHIHHSLPSSPHASSERKHPMYTGMYTPTHII